MNRVIKSKKKLTWKASVPIPCILLLFFYSIQLSIELIHANDNDINLICKFYINYVWQTVLMTLTFSGIIFLMRICEIFIYWVEFYLELLINLETFRVFFFLSFGWDYRLEFVKLVLNLFFEKIVQFCGKFKNQGLSSQSSWCIKKQPRKLPSFPWTVTCSYLIKLQRKENMNKEKLFIISIQYSGEKLLRKGN